MRFCTACHGAVSDTCGGMPSKVGLALFACFVAIVLLAEVPSSSPPEPQDFLKKQMAFTTLELSAVESGHIVVKLPKTGETREVAAFAIMQLDVPVEFFLRGMRDIVHFKRSDNVLQIGKFSDPPRLEDLSGLTLDPEEIETIRHCRVSKCDFKLPARAIDRFREEVNWSAPDYPERVTALTRQMLLDHVTGYLQDGNTALGDYDDKPYKLRLADELDALLQPAPYMYGIPARVSEVPSTFSACQTGAGRKLRVLVEGSVRPQTGCQCDARYGLQALGGEGLGRTDCLQGDLRQPLSRRLFRIDSIHSRQVVRIASDLSGLRQPIQNRRTPWFVRRLEANTHRRPPSGRGQEKHGSAPSEAREPVRRGHRRSSGRGRFRPPMKNSTYTAQAARTWPASGLNRLVVTHRAMPLMDTTSSSLILGSDAVVERAPLN